LAVRIFYSVDYRCIRLVVNANSMPCRSHSAFLLEPKVRINTRASKVCIFSLVQCLS
jgi:hypothetical protein